MAIGYSFMPALRWANAKQEREDVYHESRQKPENRVFTSKFQK